MATPSLCSGQAFIFDSQSPLLSFRGAEGDEEFFLGLQVKGSKGKVVIELFPSLTGKRPG